MCFVINVESEFKTVLIGRVVTLKLGDLFSYLNLANGFTKSSFKIEREASCSGSSCPLRQKST